MSIVHVITTIAGKGYYTHSLAHCGLIHNLCETGMFQSILNFTIDIFLMRTTPAPLDRLARDSNRYPLHVQCTLNQILKLLRIQFRESQ